MQSTPPLLKNVWDILFDHIFTDSKNFFCLPFQIITYLITDVSPQPSQQSRRHEPLWMVLTCFQILFLSHLNDTLFVSLCPWTYKHSLFFCHMWCLPCLTVLGAPLRLKPLLQCIQQQTQWDINRLSLLAFADWTVLCSIHTPHICDVSKIYNGDFNGKRLYIPNCLSSEKEECL